MNEIWGTIIGRWYVTGFAIVFAVLAVRHLGWRRTLLYTVAAFGIGVAAENASVHWGIPYSTYRFDPALRGEELHVGSVPLFVPLSYTFVAYFAYASGRVIASGPWRTRAARPWHELAVALLLGVWAVWILDPGSRVGGFYLGAIFEYAGPGWWFGLPLASQVGFTIVTAAQLAILHALARHDPDVAVQRPLRHPHLPALVIWHVEFLHLAVILVAIGHLTLGGSAFLMWVPGAVVTAVLWSHLRPRHLVVEEDPLPPDERAVVEILPP